MGRTASSARIQQDIASNTQDPSPCLRKFKEKGIHGHVASGFCLPLSIHCLRAHRHVLHQRLLLLLLLPPPQVVVVVVDDVVVVVLVVVVVVMVVVVVVRVIKWTDK